MLQTVNLPAYFGGHPTPFYNGYQWCASSVRCRSSCFVESKGCTRRKLSPSSSPASFPAGQPFRTGNRHFPPADKVQVSVRKERPAQHTEVSGNKSELSVFQVVRHEQRTLMLLCACLSQKALCNAESFCWW